MYSTRTRSIRATIALLPGLPVCLAAAAATPLLVSILPAPVHAATRIVARQDEAAASSGLTGVKLPAGAVRITDRNMARTGMGQLKRVAEGGGLSVGKTEHLAWGGGNHDADRAESVKNRLTAALKEAGYQCKSAGQKKVEGGGTMTLFVAVHQQKKQALLGIWMEGDTFLALNWGEVSKSAKPADKADRKAGEKADDETAAPSSEDEPTGEGGAS
jgi:hypothetical protein